MTHEDDRWLRASPIAIKAIVRMRAALEYHAEADCCEHVQTFLLNPTTFAQVGVDELWGTPVRSSEEVAPGHLILECVGDSERVERTLEAFIDELTG